MRLAEHMAERAASPEFPSTRQLLVTGGDARIALDPVSGLNRYGCRPYPDPELLSFGSSTASVISTQAYAAAESLRERLLKRLRIEELPVMHEREAARIHQELLETLGLNGAGLTALFATSGTDAHGMVARALSYTSERPLTVLMVAECETGSGVAAALQVRSADVQALALRHADGAPRPLTEVDADASERVAAAIAAGRHVLLVMADQSKTGLIAPSPACVAELHHRYPDHVDVLVDACQMRLSPATLRAYYRQGYMIALTGSKFLGGPSFSALLLMPEPVALRLHLATREAPPINFGLLLRWESALAEWRRFRGISGSTVADTLQAFAQAINERLESDACFEPLAVHPLERGAMIGAPGWDQHQTIFPFLLYRTDAAGRRVPLADRETQHIYQRLPQATFMPEGVKAGLRCQLGQPVACGTRQGVPVSALRLCIGARQVSEVARGRAMDQLIAEAMSALDKAAGLIGR